MTEINLENLLSFNSYITLNRSILIKYGAEAAILIGDLYSKRQYFRNKNQLSIDGYFFNTAKDIQISTGLKRRAQEKGIENLIKAEFIKTKLKGIPPKKHFKIEDKKLMNWLLSEPPQLNLYKTDKLKRAK